MLLREILSRVFLGDPPVDQPVQVDFYFDTADSATQQPLAIKGSITNSGIVDQGAGTLRANSVAQFSDFIETLVAAGRMSPATRDAGVLGSVINNTGLAPLTGLAAEDVTVEISARGNSNGQPAGTPMTLTIPKGQTRSVGQVLTALGVSPSEETILITARVTSGRAAIAGIISTVDAVTRDGSVVEMSRADF